MKRIVIWAPLLLFLLFVGVVAAELLSPSNRTIRSQLVGKPLRAFALPAIDPARPGLASTDFRGEPRLLNIFASWCVPCAAEAPQLVQLARAGVTIEAIAIRDRPGDVAAFLARWGDPFRRIGSDVDSRVQLALGSSGVPESFVVDGRGIIRHQHVGEIRAEDVPVLVAAVKAAR